MRSDKYSWHPFGSYAPDRYILLKRRMETVAAMYAKNDMLRIHSA